MNIEFTGALFTLKIQLRVQYEKTGPLVTLGLM